MVSDNYKGYLPKNAKKVFKGEIFEVWQWEQEMFDGSKEVVECVYRSGTVFILATVGDKILLQKEEHPGRGSFISLPGGRADFPGENLLDAAKRELLEETGYTSDDWELWIERQLHRKILWPLHVYFARNCVYKQPPVLAAGERIEPYFATFDQFLELAENPDFRVEELRLPMLRAKLDPKEKERLYNLIFKK